ncbi:MAG: lipid II flippase MurJ [Verrucomicrobiales bacterium]
MLRSMFTVGGFTLLSRLLGFLRDMVIARFLGTGMVADAFFAAFRFPNMFRRIFGEGAFNAAFVPIFYRTLEEEGKGRRCFRQPHVYDPRPRPRDRHARRHPGTCRG